MFRAPRRLPDLAALGLLVLLVLAGLAGEVFRAGHHIHLGSDEGHHHHFFLGPHHHGPEGIADLDAPAPHGHRHGDDATGDGRSAPAPDAAADPALIDEFVLDAPAALATLAAPSGVAAVPPPPPHEGPGDPRFRERVARGPPATLLSV